MKHYVIIYWKLQDECSPTGRFFVFAENRQTALERFLFVTDIKEINVEEIKQIEVN